MGKRTAKQCSKGQARTADARDSKNWSSVLLLAVLAISLCLSSGSYERKEAY